MKLQRQRIYTLILATTIFTSVITPSVFAATNTKSEVVYGILNSDGTVNNIYVVNEIDVTNGNILDYGNYSSIRNLSTDDSLSLEKGEVSATSKGSKLYYEGLLSEETLPWNINVSYKLNGQPISSNDLAGKSGDLEVSVSVAQNKISNKTFFDNYALQISTSLDTNICSDIKAEGATVATVGENRNISFTNLPKKEGRYIITTTVKNFEMDPISINALPFSTNIDLSALDNITESLSPLQNGISQLNTGATTLDEGATALLNAMETLDSNSSALVNASKEIANALATLKSSTAKIQGLTSEDGPIATLTKGSLEYLDASNELASKTDSLVTASNNIYKGLQGTNTALTSVATDTDQTKELLKALESMNNPQVNTLIELYTEKMAAVDGINSSLTTIVTQYNTFNNSVFNLSEGVKKLSTSYVEIHNGIQSIKESLSILNELNTAVDTLSKEYSKFYSGLESYTDAFDTILSGYESLLSGITDISAATIEINSKTENLDKDIEDKVNSSLKQFNTTDFKPGSFVSDKNTAVTAVQFVMKTTEIRKEALTVVTPTTNKKTSILEKFKNLF